MNCASLPSLRTTHYVLRIKNPQKWSHPVHFQGRWFAVPPCFITYHENIKRPCLLPQARARRAVPPCIYTRSSQYVKVWIPSHSKISLGFVVCCLLLVVWHKYQQLTTVNQQPRNIKAPVRNLGQGRVVFAVPPCIILSWFIRNGDCRLLYMKKSSFNPELTREFRLTPHTDSHHPSALWNDNHNTFSCSSPVYWVELIIHGRRPSVKRFFILCSFSMSYIYSYEIYAIWKRLYRKKYICNISDDTDCQKVIIQLQTITSYNTRNAIPRL